MIFEKKRASDEAADDTYKDASWGKRVQRERRSWVRNNRKDENANGEEAEGKVDVKHCRFL